MALKKAGSFQTCQVFFSDLLDISFNFAGDLGLDAGDCNFGFDDTKNCNLHASTHLRHRKRRFYFRNHDDFVTFLCAKTMELYYNLW